MEQMTSVSGCYGRSCFLSLQKVSSMKNNLSIKRLLAPDRMNFKTLFTKRIRDMSANEARRSCD
jgi:hypothetical protein